jgi:hypothetical protein
MISEAKGWHIVDMKKDWNKVFPKKKKKKKKK